MSKPAARIGDMHVCPMVTPGTPPIPHVGGPISGPCVPLVLIGNMPAAVLGDMCVCVGPPDSIVLGSTGVLIGNKPAARMGDSTAHGGTIVAGFPMVLIGEIASGGPVTPVVVTPVKVVVPAPVYEHSKGGETSSTNEQKNNQSVQPSSPSKGDKGKDPGTVEARIAMAKKFYKENTDWSDQRIASHLKGIDFNEPIQIVEIPKDTVLTQWQASDGAQGNYFAEEGTSPTNLGISPNSADKFNANKRNPKKETSYKAEKPVMALKSKAAPVVDNWSESIKGPESENSFVIVRESETAGGGTQYFVPEKEAFQL